MLPSPTTESCCAASPKNSSSICMGLDTAGCNAQIAASCQKASMLLDVTPGACDEMHLACLQRGPGGVLCMVQCVGCWGAWQSRRGLAASGTITCRQPVTK